jgi:hypothetical protein
VTFPHFIRVSLHFRKYKRFERHQDPANNPAFSILAHVNIPISSFGWRDDIFIFFRGDRQHRKCSSRRLRRLTSNQVHRWISSGSRQLDQRKGTLESPRVHSIDASLRVRSGIPKRLSRQRHSHHRHALFAPTTRCEFFSHRPTLMYPQDMQPPPPKQPLASGIGGSRTVLGDHQGTSGSRVKQPPAIVAVYSSIHRWKNKSRELFRHAFDAAVCLASERSCTGNRERSQSIWPINQ